MTSNHSVLASVAGTPKCNVYAKYKYVLLSFGIFITPFHSYSVLLKTSFFSVFRDEDAQPRHFRSEQRFYDGYLQIIHVVAIVPTRKLTFAGNLWVQFIISASEASRDTEHGHGKGTRKGTRKR